MLTSSKTFKTAAGLLIGASLAPLAAAGNFMAPAYTPDLLPANPTTGMCYARVEIPAEYTNVAEGVMVEEGYTTVEVANPQLASRQEQVLTKEASVRYEVRQPSFTTVSEQIMTRPAYDKLTVTPPSFSHVTETLASSAPRLVWKKGNPGALMRQGYKIHSTADGGQNGQGYRSTVEFGETGGAMNCGPTCEIWCLVEEPGETVQFQRKVVSSQARVERQTVPARFQTVMKQVVSDPGGVREIPVPAQFQTIMVEDIVQQGGERQVTVPPKFATVNKKQLVSAERYEWRQVVCQDGTAPSVSQNLTSSATMISPSHVTTMHQQPAHSTSYSTTTQYGTQYDSGYSGTAVAPTVDEMLAGNSNAVCLQGRDCNSADHGGYSSNPVTSYESGSWGH